MAWWPRYAPSTGTPVGALSTTSRDTDLIRGARAGRDDCPIRVELEEFLERDPVVASDEDLGLELPEVLNRVVCEGGVIVYNPNPHKFRDCSKEKTTRQSRGTRRIQGRNMFPFAAEEEVEEILDA